MVYLSALQTPVHLQWDPSSRLPLPDPGSASYNCGPTTIVNIAHFYRDQPFGIYDTRRLAVWDNYRGTSVNEQAEMLRQRGVPCHIDQPNLFEIHNLVGGGRRPILLGLDMAKVPEYVAGHPFRGHHAVEILQTAYTNEGRSRGFWVRDPNFNRTYRTDPTGGQRFYADWIIDVAFCNSGMWGVVPDRVKDVPSSSLPSTTKADGDPAPMKFRTEVSPKGQATSRIVQAGKPIRAGVSVNSRTVRRFDQRKELHFVGRVLKESLPVGERQYGDVLFGPVYTGSGYVLGYVKQVDLAGN